MNIFLLFLFAAIVILAFLEEYIPKKYMMYILGVLYAIMITAAGFKDASTVADAEAYETMFYNNENELISIATEPTFIYLSRIILTLGGGITFIFCIYAICSIPLKMEMIKRMTPFFFTAMLIYIPVYYELHDLVQIRAAVAGAFLMLSVKLCADRKYIHLLITFIIAILFHYSSAAFLPFFILGNKAITPKGKILMGAVVPIGFLMYFLHIDLFSFLPSTFLIGKIDFYKSSSDDGSGLVEMVTPYKNVYFLAKCILFYLLLYFNDYLKNKAFYFPILMKIEAGSLFIMLSMATIPVIATRISDLFGIIDAVLFSYCLYIVKPMYIARLGIACIGLYMLVYNFLVADYFG